MRLPYSLADVTRRYEEDLTRRGGAIGNAEELQDLGVLARREALLLSQGNFEESTSDRYALLHGLCDMTFIEAYQSVERLFELIDIAPPGPQSFADDGVDWRRMAKAYEQLVLRNADPALVISPVLPLVPGATEALEANWQMLYAILTENSGPNGPHLRSRPDGDGLQLGTFISASGVPGNLFNEEQSQALVADKHCLAEEDSGIIWTVSVVSLSAAASQGNLPFSALAGEHIRLSEYLALQALRIRAGQTPIDEFSWTWLEGVIDADSEPRALAGVWVPGYGQIRLYTNPVGYAQERLLTRIPNRA